MESSTDDREKLIRKPDSRSLKEINKAKKALNLIRAYRTRLEREEAESAKRTGKPDRTRRTVARILTAARTVFVTDGHANLSLRKVADQAGIAVGNLTYHFPTKQDLLEAMLREALADYVEQHLTHLDPTREEPVEIILNVMEFYVRNAREHYNFFFQLWGYAGSSEQARKTVRELYQPLGRFIYHLVRAANPKLTEAETRRAVVQISSLEEGYKLFIGMGIGAAPTLRPPEEEIRALTRRIIESP